MASHSRLPLAIRGGRVVPLEHDACHILLIHCCSFLRPFLPAKPRQLNGQRLRRDGVVQHSSASESPHSPKIRSGGPPQVLTRRTPVPTPERTASADGYPSACTCCTCVLASDCRLRHSGSLERDSSPPGTFPTEWPGSQQERHVGVKHSWSRKNASCSASLGKNGALVSCPGEATSLGGLCQGLP